MRRLILSLALASLFVMTSGPLAGDTGTYRIQSYRVGLTPRSDGTVAIEYYQRWLVTGGHIPWITVGTPNSDYAITARRGAAVDVTSANQGSWSGVRLDLDGDYQPGETFEVGFSIIQRRLFYATEGNYKLDFTPGWYDRAATDSLRVSVKFFADLQTVSADPPTTHVSDDVMTWERYGLEPGERFSIQVSFPMGSFPSAIAKENLKGGSGGGSSGGMSVVTFIIVVIIVLVFISLMSSRKRRYSGGSIFYGGLPGSRGGRGTSPKGRTTGRGGGFGGASMSCACACVSCACACACAGGSGAGCTRKLEHTCPVCGEKRR